MSGEFLEKKKNSSREISSTFSCLPLEVIHDEDEEAAKRSKGNFPVSSQSFRELSDEDIFEWNEWNEELWLLLRHKQSSCDETFYLHFPLILGSLKCHCNAFRPVSVFLPFARDDDDEIENGTNESQQQEKGKKIVDFPRISRSWALLKGLALTWISNWNARCR